MLRRLALFAAFTAGAATSADAAILRVLTYNIHHGEGKDGVLNLNRLASVISAANPDIVSLQEVDNDVPRTNNVNQVARLGELTGMTSFFGKARNLDGGGYGNGVLVKPSISVVSTVNRALPNPDNVEARAVLELNLSVDANPTTTEFKFFATHLMHDSSAGRIASAGYINDLVSTSAVPSILAGDMNFNPGSTAFNTLANQWTDVTNIANSGKNRANQIDYIFARSSLQWNVVTRSQFIVNATTNVASDHHPLLSVLELLDATPTLVWNGNSGASVAMTDGFATSNGSLGVGSFPVSPWESGVPTLIVGYGGKATFSGSASRTVGSLRIGTDVASGFIAGRNGDGTLTVSGSVSLALSNSGNTSGDLVVGEGGFQGTLNWNSTGTLDAQGRLRVGEFGSGDVVQTRGALAYRAGLTIGAGATGSARYRLSGGMLALAPGGSGAFALGSDGATGTLRVEGTAIVTHGDTLTLAGGAQGGGGGRLELVGSSASVQIGELANATGSDRSETISWQADAAGITPLVVTPAGMTAQPVQLQSLAELAANVGSGGSITGNGVALELNLAALAGTQTITLIDNRSTAPVTGFFENGSTGMLYGEGATIFGTGFNGAVTISYLGASGVGSAGNDVVLQLTAAPASADFNGDGIVDGADFLVWQRDFGDPAGLELWRQTFGQAASSVASTAVPEPSTFVICFIALAAAGWRKRR
ncbi:endonuclease/exonuclease/phosphatase family protein [Lacipirellula sp.]|uniref:endonuclease/exonuclease/phosphatase family protein n=1 Tax=Lacipirellula sp. TaxID=2691419 RepID=UPI003D0FFD0E